MISRMACRCLIALACLLAIQYVAAATAKAGDLEYFYDPAGRLAAVVDTVNGSGVYTYDANGNLLSQAVNSASALVIAQVAPSAGPVGTLVTISGTGFGTTANTTVSFNGTAASPTTVTATAITVPVPNGASTGPVSVTSPAGTVTTTSNYSVSTPVNPTLTSFSPAIAATGSSVTINGSGFDTNLTHDKVYINGRAAGLTAVTASALTITVPPVTSGYVTVETPNGSVGTPSYIAISPPPYTASQVSSVTPATLGGTATASIGGAGDIALVLFDATAGQRVSFEVTSSSFSSGTLALYAPSVAVVTSTSLSSSAFIGGTVLPQTGTYALTVAPTGGATSGSTAISLFNAPTLSSTIAANGTPVSLTATAPGENMILTFSGTAGQVVSLVESGGGGFTNCCAILSVTAPDGVTQLYSNQFAGGAFTDAPTLPTTGTYTILLNPEAALTGSVSFTLYRVPAATSGTISANGTAVSLSTTVPTQNANLTFSGTAGQVVSLVESGTGGGFTGCCLILSVTAPDGVTQLYSNQFAGSAFTDALTLPTTGTYTILLDPQGALTDSASFTLYTVPAAASGTISANGTAVSLSTTVPAQNANLTFSGTAGQVVSLVESGIGGGFTGCCLILSVTAPDGVTKLYSNQFFSGTFTDALTLPTTGTYTILLDPQRTLTGSASFTLYTVPPPAGGTITANGTASSFTTTEPR
jgi:YD repeat-containing protein